MRRHNVAYAMLLLSVCLLSGLASYYVGTHYTEPNTRTLAAPTYDAACAQDGYDTSQCASNPAGAQTVIYWARCNKAGHYEVSVTQTRYDAAQLHTEQFFPIPANFYREVLGDPIMTCDPVPLHD